MSIAVRRPSGVHAIRKPHISVIGHVAPIAVIVQVVITDDVSGYVAGGFGALFAIVAGAAPIIEFVQISRLAAVVR